MLQNIGDFFQNEVDGKGRRKGAKNAGRRFSNGENKRKITRSFG